MDKMNRLAPGGPDIDHSVKGAYFGMAYWNDGNREEETNPRSPHNNEYGFDVLKIKKK